MRKKKYVTKLLSVLLTLIMCLGLSAAAYAAEDEEPPVEAMIIKTLQMDKHVSTVPTTRFEFTFEAVSVDGRDTEEDKKEIPGILKKTIEFGAADTPMENGELKEMTKRTENVIPVPSSFPHAGVYRYRVAETEITLEGLTCSQASYLMDIYVFNKDGTRGIGGVVIHREMTDEGTDVTSGGKVEPDPAFPARVSMLFINKYVKAGGGDDPAAKALTITNTVEGNLGDRTKQFEYMLTLNTLPELVDPDTVYIGTIKRVAGGAETVTLILGESVTFTLAHGEELSFADLPVGATYTVSQTEYPDYIKTVVVTSDGAEVTGAASESDVLIGEKLNKVDYTNTKDDTVPTGIIVNNLPFFILILVAVCGLAGYLVYRRRC